MNSDLTTIAEEYKAGAALASLAKKHALAYRILRRNLVEMGVALRQQRTPASKRDTNEKIAAFYKKGASTSETAAAMGMSRDTVYQRLYDMGYSPLNRSEAMYLRMSKLSAEERLALANKAHVAWKGSKKEQHQLVARAAMIEASQKLSPQEELCCQYLTLAGLTVKPLMAAFKYNIDLAIHDSMVAVEVHNSWHTADKKAKEDAVKLNYLAENGWLVMYVHNNKHREQALDAVIAICRMRQFNHP